jgi:hypothetical protein
MSPDQIARLPKFAQQHIENLTRQLESTQKLIEKCAKTVDDYDPGINFPDYAGRGVTRRSIPGTSARLVVDRHRWLDASIKDDGIYIMTSGHWDAAIMPQSSNTFFVKFLKP